MRAHTQVLKIPDYLEVEPYRNERYLVSFLNRWPKKQKTGSFLLPIRKLDLPRTEEYPFSIFEDGLEHTRSELDDAVRTNYHPDVVLHPDFSFYRMLLRHTVPVTHVLPSRGRQPPTSETKRRLQGFRRQRYSISGATAALLIHHVEGQYSNICVGDQYLAGDLVWREIRTARLGVYIEEYVLGTYLRGRVERAAKNGYDLSHGEIGSCHNIAVSILHSFHSDSIHKAGMALQTKVDHMCNLLQGWRGNDDIRLIALQQALAYASLVGLLKDILEDSIRDHSSAELAFAAMTTVVSAGAGAASSMAGSGVERLAVTSVDGAGSVLQNKLKTKHARLQGRYRQLIVDVVDKFNVEVLLRADRGKIRTLDTRSPPSDPDGLQLRCPDRHLASRPTPYDISLFKQTAINVFLAAARQEGVTLSQESSRAAVASPFNDPLNHVTIGELLAYAGHSGPSKPNPPHFVEHALQAELVKHFPSDQVDDWYTLIKRTARHTTWPVAVHRNPELPRISAMTLSMTPGWNQQIYPFLLGGHGYDGVMSLAGTENWYEAKSAMDRLRVKIQSAEKRLPEEVEIVDKVRYFFCDPPTLAQNRDLESCFCEHFDYLTWRTSKGEWFSAISQPPNLVCPDPQCRLCEESRSSRFRETNPVVVSQYVERPPVK